MGDYGEYRYLDITVDDGVALIEITNREYTMRGHYELNAIWRELDRDRDVRSAILTWAVPASKEPLGTHYPPEMGPEAREDDPAKWWSHWQWPMREAREGIRDLMESNYEIMNIQGDPDTMVAAMWGKAEQGQPAGYDVATRPPLPSVANPYGPDQLP